MGRPKIFLVQLKRALPVGRGGLKTPAFLRLLSGDQENKNLPPIALPQFPRKPVFAFTENSTKTNPVMSTLLQL